MTTQRLTVVPAYGRDYKSQAEVKTAWKEGKDFIVQDFFSGQDGRAVNREDVEGQDVKIMVRYAKLTKVFQVN